MAPVPSLGTSRGLKHSSQRTHLSLAPKPLRKRNQLARGPSQSSSKMRRTGKKHIFSEEEDNFIANKLADPYIYSVLSEPGHRNRSIRNVCSKAQIHADIARDFKATCGIDISALQVKNKIAKMQRQWNEACAISNMAVSNNMPLSTVDGDIRKKCHFFGILQETWSQPRSMTPGKSMENHEMTPQGESDDDYHDDEEDEISHDDVGATDAATADEQFENGQTMDGYISVDKRRAEAITKRTVIHGEDLLRSFRDAAEASKEQSRQHEETRRAAEQCRLDIEKEHTRRMELEILYIEKLIELEKVRMQRIAMENGVQNDYLSETENS